MTYKTGIQYIKQHEAHRWDKVGDLKWVPTDIVWDLQIIFFFIIIFVGNLLKLYLTDLTP